MDALTFEIVGADRVEADAPLSVQFRLTNRGSEPLVVNGRLAVTGAGGPGDVQLSASLDAGAVPFIADVNLGAPKAGDFRRLAPGEAVQRDVDLRRYLLVRGPGRYRIAAVYQNKAQGVDGLAAVSWTGEVAAEPLIVTVEPARRR